MNRDHRHHLDDDGAVDLGRHRLAGELRAAARLVELAPGSEVAAVARGRRLRERRRRATALAAVVAVGGGSAAAIQQLDGGGDSFLAGTASSVASIPDPSVVEAPPAPPPATEPAPVGPVTIDPASLTLPEVVEPLYAWNVVEPDSAEAVGFTMKIGDIPGLALASEPGRSDEYRPAVWRSDDGVSWEQVELDLPFGTLQQLDFEGDTIYLVGTAPGVAAGEPNPLTFATSADLGATWDTIELPVDTGEVNDTPYVRTVSDYADPIPLDDGSSLVVVSRSIDVDAEAIGAELGIDPAGAWVIAESGITFFTGCSPGGLSARPSAAPAVAGGIAEVAPVTTAAYPVGTAPDAGCEERLVTWDETGLPPELVDGVTMPQIRVFHVVGDVATELDVPEGMYGSAGVAGPVFSGENSWYRFEDGAFVEIPPADGGAGPIGESASTQFWIGTPAAFPSTLDPGIFVAASSDGATTDNVDWTPLYGEGRYGYPMATAVGETGLVMASQVWNDAITADGGVSVEVDGYTISRASRRDPLQVVTPDGEAVDPALVTVDDALVVRGTDGSEAARFTIPSNTALERAVWGYLPPDDRPADFLLMTSTDGRRVSVESIPDLLGVDVDEVASVDRVTPVGQQVVVAVTLRERGPDDLPRQLVLVGTPVG